MYQLTLWAILFFPFTGLIFIGMFPDEYYWLTSGGSVIAPLVYYSLFLLGAAGAVLKFNKNRFQIIDKLPGQFRSELPLLILMFIILVIVFVGYGGLSVLIGDASKEDMRQSGFIYSILTKYLLPSIFAYISARRRAQLVTRGQWWLAFLMTLAAGLSMGGKASALIAILPGLAILFSNKLTFLWVLIVAAGVFMSLISAAWLFDSFLERNALLIVGYLAHRAFVLTAEAPFHVGVAYSENQPIIEYHYTLFEVFGKSVLSNFVGQHEIHKYLFSHAFTAWLYPDNIDAITTGAWNITPNAFVEALIVGGPFLLPVLGWAVVYAAYVLWARMVRQINRGKYASAAITSVYAVIVYLSWTNSAGIMQLIHPLAVVSLALSWMCLRTLTSFSLQPRQHKRAFASEPQFS
jgi:hypothetical protein